MDLVKAHALGNDFLLTADPDARRCDAVVQAEIARAICNRHRGIGADGLMFVTETADGADTTLFNADGSRAEVSGNGVRCAAAWMARRRGLTPGAHVVIGTAAGPKRLELLEAAGARLTFRADMGAPKDLRQVTIQHGAEHVSAVVLNIGNPQCVVLEPPTAMRLETVAAGLAVHSFFPNGTNVELAGVEAPDRVRILIWERGVGPTEASGTGACAAAVAAAFAGGAARASHVISPGGTQYVEWTDETVWLTGWAEVVAEIAWLAP